MEHSAWICTSGCTLTRKRPLRNMALEGTSVCALLGLEVSSTSASRYAGKGRCGASAVPDVACSPLALASSRPARASPFHYSEDSYVSLFRSVCPAQEVNQPFLSKL